MNEFNVLLAAATNGTPSGSLFDALFARYIALQDSWRELESPLPITILAAGEDLIDYRIYGNTVGGEFVGERTENLLDKNAPDYEKSCFYDQNNTKYINIAYAESGYIPVEAGTYSIVTTVSVTGRVLIANFFDTNKNFDSNLLYRINPPKVSTLTIPSDGYVRFNISLGGSYTNTFMFIEGSTAPASYIPYGYKLPMVVTNGTATTTTPIYIGPDPLAEDEYVDFGEQKIYRVEGGTLTPTDPPVSIPALPTIRGGTIIDYNPSTTPAVEPEKMYIKYKPQ